MVLVTNNGPRPFSPSWVRVYAAANGTSQREIIDPVSGCNGLAGSAPLMPRETRGITTCWQGDDGDQSLTFVTLDATDTATFGTRD